MADAAATAGLISLQASGWYAVRLQALERSLEVCAAPETSANRLYTHPLLRSKDRTSRAQTCCYRHAVPPLDTALTSTMLCDRALILRSHLTNMVVVEATCRLDWLAAVRVLLQDFEQLLSTCADHGQVEALLAPAPKFALATAQRGEPF